MAKNSLFCSRPYGVWDRMGTTTSLPIGLMLNFRKNNHILYANAQHKRSIETKAIYIYIM